MSRLGVCVCVRVGVCGGRGRVGGRAAVSPSTPHTLHTTPLPTPQTSTPPLPPHAARRAGGWGTCTSCTLTQPGWRWRPCICARGFHVSWVGGWAGGWAGEQGVGGRAGRGRARGGRGAGGLAELRRRPPTCSHQSTRPYPASPFPPNPPHTREALAAQPPPPPPPSTTHTHEKPWRPSPAITCS